MTQMQEPSALGRIVELVRDLRDRCPWDRKQTRATLRPYLVEEVLELDHALAGDDAEAIQRELGDVLLHMAFQIVLGEEAGAFGAEDVTNAIVTKMRQRHPHLFDLGDEPETWERQKRKELEVLITDAIESLSDKYREVILLRHKQELPYEEIAEILSVPLGTVKARLFRARELLKKRLKSI